MTEEIKSVEAEEEKPPVFKSWNKLYIFVLAQTAILILFFYIFTRFFR